MKNVLEIIKDIEANNNVTVLYACETGSRAWGFASPDSDYDIRFIYKHNPEWYLSLSEKKDFINMAIKDDLDITGWDLRKSLQLLQKSNAALIERFQSPIEYFSVDDFKKDFNNLIKEYYSPIAVFYHHYSLARKFREDIVEKDEIKLKSYFYLVRSLLSCNWIVKNTGVVPMDIESLMTLTGVTNQTLLKELIKLKSTVGEKYLHKTDAGLINLVTELFDFVDTYKNKLKANNSKSDSLDKFFLKNDIMKPITVDSVKQNGWLVFEVITGSKAYGLDNAKSDTDIKGVFVLPKELYYGLNYVEQVNNETNDIVYYELKRFVDLLSKNNPNILEMLSVPEHCVLFKHSFMDVFTPQAFLSKLCEKTFANYAFTQIKKAYGLEKKILNPVEEERKSVLDFCFIYKEKEAVPLIKHLRENNIEQSKMGLTAIAHLRDCYNVYYSSNDNYYGVVKTLQANDVHLSSIPKGEQSIAMLYFNKDAYSVYCKKYKEYWDWVEKRNDERYKNTLSHGKNYDAKNMLHVFRLLNMAKEIATENSINVHRKDRAFLLSIKAGEFEYDELVKMAEKLKDELPSLFQISKLQDEPDIEFIEKLLVNTREQFYLKQTK